MTKAELTVFRVAMLEASGVELEVIVGVMEHTAGSYSV